MKEYLAPIEAAQLERPQWEKKVIHSLSNPAYITQTGRKYLFRFYLSR